MGGCRWNGWKVPRREAGRSGPFRGLDWRTKDGLRRWAGERIWAGVFRRASTERNHRRQPPGRPGSEVRASIVVRKPGNAGGAKGRREMDV